MTMRFLRAAVTTEITIIIQIIKAYYYIISSRAARSQRGNSFKTRNTHFSASTRNYPVIPTNYFIYTIRIPKHRFKFYTPRSVWSSNHDSYIKIITNVQNILNLLCIIIYIAMYLYCVLYY